jgi:uncharacterized membrane protein
MKMRRFLRNIGTTPWHYRKAFPPKLINEFEARIKESEQIHRGEIVLAIEPWLGLGRLIRNDSLRRRAVEVFSHLHVWDTEENNGVLIFVALADREAELVPDRALVRCRPVEFWTSLAKEVSAKLAEGRYTEAIDCAITKITEVLVEVFPSGGPHPNQLPDKPFTV